MSELLAKIAELQGRIRELAAEGDTFGCDILHGRIADLERAMAILSGEIDS